MKKMDRNGIIHFSGADRAAACGSPSAERLAWVAELEVLPPASQVSVDLTHEFADRLEADGRSGHLPQRLPLSCQCFQRRLQPQIAAGTGKRAPRIPKAVAQKV